MGYFPGAEPLGDPCRLNHQMGYFLDEGQLDEERLDAEQPEHLQLGLAASPQPGLAPQELRLPEQQELPSLALAQALALA